MRWIPSLPFILRAVPTIGLRLPSLVSHLARPSRRCDLGDLAGNRSLLGLIEQTSPGLSSIGLRLNPIDWVSCQDLSLTV
ncbi:hypothetical protein WH7805_13928 [Synechococcus sp. WH 7805]|nr:hypothetical protein WH7805_13928 [Synechococcus sp. WH 7805]